MRKKATTKVMAMVLVSGLCATAAMAADVNTPAEPMETAGASGSMQVAFFDPITKKLRAPTVEEAANFANKLKAERALKAQSPSTSGRPRNEAESQRTARTVRVNGYTMVAVETPETEFSYLRGVTDAQGNLRVSHASDAAESTTVEVAK